MTSIAFDAMDLVNVVASIRDRESAQLVGRVVEAQITMLQAQVAQLQQLHGAIKERLQSTK